MGKNIRYENFTGGLNTVSSIGTINQTPRRTESPDMVNMEYYKLGGLKSMEGNTQFGDTQSAKVTSGFDYRKGNDRIMVITLDDGSVKIYDDITETFSTIYTFPTETSRHTIVSFNFGIVISNGVDDLVYYQKDRADTLSGAVSGNISTKNVVGTSTKFTTELHKGDYVIIDGNTYVVDTITDDTNLTLVEDIVGTFSNENIVLSELSLCDAVLVNTDDPTFSQEIRGLAIQSYMGRIFVGGNDGTLYYSEVGKYNGWDIKYQAGGIPPFYSDSSDIYALGLYSSYLTIHRVSYTYFLDGQNEPDTWNLTPYADISCESPQSWVSVNNAYYVFSRKNGGIYPLLKRTIFSDKFVGDELSVKIRNLFDYLDYSNLDKIYCVSNPIKRYLLMYMPMLNGNYSNTAFIFDFQTNTWLIRKVPQMVTCAFRYNDKVYIGTADGKVLQEFKGKTFDGAPIEAYWKSPWIDFGDGSNYTSIREFRIQIPEDEVATFYLRNRRDGLDRYDSRLITNDKEDVVALVWSDDSELITDTEWDNNDWIATGFSTKRFPLPNSYFQSMQVELYCKETGQGINVYSWELHGVEKEEVDW